jgi:hypothetical protein
MRPCLRTLGQLVAMRKRAHCVKPHYLRERRNGHGKRFAFTNVKSTSYCETSRELGLRGGEREKEVRVSPFFVVGQPGHRVKPRKVLCE